ncbi:hypothetical protein RI367_005445, partial [Sorochytrium milnesiophthora]
MPRLPADSGADRDTTYDVDLRAFCVTPANLLVLFGADIPVHLCHREAQVTDHPDFTGWTCISQGPFHVFVSPQDGLRLALKTVFRDLKNNVVQLSANPRALITGQAHVALADLVAVLDECVVEYVRYFDFGLKMSLEPALRRNLDMRHVYDHPNNNTNMFDISWSVPTDDIVLFTLPRGMRAVHPMLGFKQRGWLKFKIPTIPNVTFTVYPLLAHTIKSVCGRKQFSARTVSTLQRSLRDIRTTYELIRGDPDHVGGFRVECRVQAIDPIAAVEHLDLYGVGPAHPVTNWVEKIWTHCDNQGWIKYDLHYNVSVHDYLDNLGVVLQGFEDLGLAQV